VINGHLRASQQAWENKKKLNKVYGAQAVSNKQILYFQQNVLKRNIKEKFLPMTIQYR
jgi:hypothetical protein